MCVCLYTGVFFRKAIPFQSGQAGHRPFLITGFVSPEVNRVLRVLFKMVTIVLSKKPFH